MGKDTEDDGIAVTEEQYVLDGWDTAKPGAVGTENFDVAMDLDGDDDVIVRRLFGANFDDLLGRQDGAGDVLWYGTDHLGSVRTIFDNSGDITHTIDYDAFGGFLGGVSVDRYAYTGREWDDALGLQFSRARMYDPVNGRWMSEDPIKDDAANLYRYVANGATNATDPSGLYWVVDRPGDYQKFEDFFKESGIRFGWQEAGRSRYYWFDPADREKLKDALLKYYSTETVEQMLDAAFDNQETHQMYTGGDPRRLEWRNETEAAPYIVRGYMRNTNLGNGIDRSKREQFLETALSGKTECQTLKGDSVVNGLTISNPELKEIRSKEQTGTIAAASIFIGTKSLFDIGINVLQEITGIPFIPTKSKPKAPAAGRPLGARGPASGREFDPNLAGGPVRQLTTDNIRITNRGIDVVEQHVARFGPDVANQGMVQRLRDIAAGRLQPTQADLNFYSHELREFVRYRRLGWRTGQPNSADAAYDLWNNAHTATLEDYLLREGPGVLYHPCIVP